MRIAVVSDIHGNGTAFEAVLADLRGTSPDVVFHGGDLADGGSSPVEIVDRIRDLGWQGVLGNTDEMLSRPESLRDFAREHPALEGLFRTVEEMAAATREALGEERLAWLGALPRIQAHGPMALVHGSPETPWRAPGPEASDEELASVYGALGKPVAVYAHIHRPFVRQIARLVVANTGSIGLSYDGDRRAAYLLIDGTAPTVRRVEYDVAAERRNLSGCGFPHADWVASLLEGASFRMP
jgi:predicted phosphodiesterase